MIVQIRLIKFDLNKQTDRNYKKPESNQMKASIKQPKGKDQPNRSKPQKQITRQDNEDFELKIKKVQKQIVSLNLQIESFLEQRKFKDSTLKALVRERKKLENCFLFKNYQASKEMKQGQNQNIIQSQTKTIQQARPKFKNHFRDVNQPIVRCLKQLQALKDQQPFKEVQKKSSQPQYQPQQPNRKLQCQSLHLRQIFNPEQTLNHQTKASNLKQRLSLIYQKIKLNLQREQPYLHEKIMERIRRQAQSYSRKKLLQQIDKLIKQNSVWMKQQTNRVSNQLEEQKVEEICVNNLGLMKRIMAKKVANNDWIFQNYSDDNYAKGSGLGFPVQKITKQYQEVIKKIQAQRIAGQLAMVRKGNSQKGQASEEQSLKEVLSIRAIKNLMEKQRNYLNQWQETQRQLTDRVQTLRGQIQKLGTP